MGYESVARHLLLFILDNKTGICCWVVDKKNNKKQSAVAGFEPRTSPSPVEDPGDIPRAFSLPMKKRQTEFFLSSLCLNEIGGTKKRCVHVLDFML